MRIAVLDCASGLTIPTLPTDVTVLSLPAIPTRRDLRPVDELCADAPAISPTLEEIAASPSVPHMGAPARISVGVSLRLVVVGSDAALAAVVTRLMRADYMWVEVAYVPVSSLSPAAVNWGLSSLSTPELFSLALDGPVRPVPLIRDDRGNAVAGCAYVSDFPSPTSPAAESSSPTTPTAGPPSPTELAPPRELAAEIAVDDVTLLPGPTDGVYGAKLVPELDAPGLAAVRLVAASERSGFWHRLFSKPASNSPQPDPSSLATGRAMQVGGENILVTIDGVGRPRPVDRCAFYRHLRDLQAVRP